MTNHSLARFLLSGATVLSGFVGAQLLAADADRLVAANVAMQDEARKLPQDNTAYFSRADRRVRFELVKLSGGSGDMLAGTNITVIGPRGEESAITADADGIATLENAEPGLHAMVVAGPKGHTAVPIALREETAADVADAVESPLPPPVKLSLVDIDPKEVLRLASSYLPPKMKGSFEDTDGELVSTGQVFESPHYRVQLGDEATLDGQVYSMISSGLSTSNVEGTNILIYRGNSLVARTATDQFGKFSFDEMTPGVYALVAAGTSGYACFGFEAYSVPAVAKISHGETLVSVRRSEGQLTSSVMARGTVIPVVLIPPSMVPGVFNQIRTAGRPTGSQTPVGTTPSFGTPTGGAPGGVGSGVAGGGLGGGGLGGGGLGGGLGGGIGGLGGLLAAGAIGAAVLGSDDNNNNNSFIPLPSTNGGM